MIGGGIYVVAGQVAKELAGPSVLVSFIIASVTAIFAGEFRSSLTQLSMPLLNLIVITSFLLIIAGQQLSYFQKE